MIETDLFDFAYVPDWYGQLDELSKLALPEPWRFKKPIYKTKNEDTPYWSGTYILFSESRALILIQKGMPGKRQVIFMWKMSVPVFIQDYTHPDTKGFMPALIGTIKRLR